MNNYMYLVPVAAVIALLFAAYLAAKVSRQDAGTERMKEIAGAIADGARPLKRYIQKNVETMVAKMILGNELEPGDCINVDADANGLTTTTTHIED